MRVGTSHLDKSSLRRLTEQGFQAKVKQGGFFLNASCGLGFRQQVIAQVERRSHADEYARMVCTLQAPVSVQIASGRLADRFLVGHLFARRAPFFHFVLRRALGHDERSLEVSGRR